MPDPHPLLDELRSLGLPAGDYAVFGSGPLLARGWIADAGDLDVVARGRAWTRAAELGPLVHLAEWHVDVIEIGSAITIGRTWAIGDVDVDDLIDSAEWIDGLPFARLELVADYKRVAGRPKDRDHLAIIERHSS